MSKADILCCGAGARYWGAVSMHQRNTSGRPLCRGLEPQSLSGPFLSRPATFLGCESE